MRYCCVASLDITKTFDKFWHTEFLQETKKDLLYQTYEIIKSYISN